MQCNAKQFIFNLVSGLVGRESHPEWLWLLKTQLYALRLAQTIRCRTKATQGLVKCLKSEFPAISPFLCLRLFSFTTG